MRFAGRCFGVSISTVALVIMGWAAPVRAGTNGTHKIVIYPQANETFEQLQSLGVKKARNYGAYWLVKNATDEQVQALKDVYGARATSGHYLDVIELDACAVNTAGAEPSIPSQLRQATPHGKRLRLVQFPGPIVPEWLDQLKAAGDVRIAAYIPNNAYLVWMDGAAEKNVRKLLDPAGPIQWIGPYHPYYKLKGDLKRTAAGQVRVRVGLVDSPESDSSVSAIAGAAIGKAGGAHVYRGHKNLDVTVDGSRLAQIAQLPDVIWVEPVIPATLQDEVQGLIVAGYTNGPGHGPVAGTGQYLDFLLNRVGVPTDAGKYPVVDVADSGLENGTIYPYHPAFYTQPLPLVTFMDDLQFGSICQTGLPIPRILYNDGADAYDAIGIEHGTLVSSIISGFDTLDSEVVSYWTPGIRVESLVPTFQCTTNTTINCDGGNPPTCLTNISITCGIATNCLAQCNDVQKFIFIPRRDSNGFQYGLGINPFGRMGMSLIFGAAGAGSGFVTVSNAFNEVLNAYLRTARIGNNSWGERLVVGLNDGVYNSLSQAYDTLARDAVGTGSPGTPGPSPLNQEYILVFAGGNNNGISPVGGFGDVLTTPPATAKNILAVGATENTRPYTGCAFPTDADDSFDISFFNSFGPTRDGRFKPEIVAPGSSIVGATVYSEVVRACIANPVLPVTPPPVSCDQPIDVCAPFTPEEGIDSLYSCGSGTSFSAPAVSGAMQLLWWYFQNPLSMLPPSPAMAKAYMLNSARYLPTADPLTGVLDTLPSISQGMGELDLAKMFDGVPRVLRDQSTARAIDSPLITTNPVSQQTYFNRSGQTYEFQGQVFDPTQPFRVTIAWTDAPASPASFKSLVNDLDLVVTIGGKTYAGNAFRGAFSVDDPTLGVDDLNNVESVFLPPGQTGRWSIVVRAVNVAGDGVPNLGASLDQDFAAVVYNATPESDVPNYATNDTCQSAIKLTSLPTVVTNSITKGVYHNVLPSPTAGRGGVEAVWVIPTGPAGTLYSVSSAGSTTNMILSIWQGVCGALEEVISTTLSAPVNFASDGTNNFYIVAEGANDSTGTVVFTVNVVNPSIEVTPSFINFGSQDVGTTSTPRVIVMKNVGSTVVSMGTAQIGGFNPNDFVIVGDACSGQSLLPGSSCGISVVFRPTVTLGSSAQLRITSSAPTSPHTVSLTGNGVAASAVLRFIPSGVLSFGSVPTGQGGITQSAIVTNAGTASMVITDVSISGTNATDFTIVTDGCLGSTIQPGGICIIAINFDPGAVGFRRATLSVSSTASAAPQTLSLVGTGVQPPTALAFLPSSLAFGNGVIGSISSPQTVIVSNQSPTSVLVSSVIVDDTADFDITENCSNLTLAPSNTCGIVVTFHPQAAGLHQATVTVFHNGIGSPSSFPVTGTGILPPPPAPAVSLNPTGLSFGLIPVGTTSDFQRVTVSNVGSTNLFVTATIPTGANGGEFIANGTNCLAGAVAAGGSCFIDVAFNPASAGIKVAALSIFDDATNSPQQVSLTAGIHAQPDALIRLKTAPPFIGKKIFNSSGVDQTVSIFVSNGVTETFFVRLRNAGNIPDQFVVSGPGSKKGFTVQYYLGKTTMTNITGVVTAGGYTTAMMAPGEIAANNAWIRMDVMAGAAVSSGTKLKLPVTATSTVDLSGHDTVKGIVTLECESIPVLSVTDVPYAKNNIDLRLAVDSVGSPTCGGGGRDTVFRLAPSLTTAGRQFTVDTFDSNFNTMLSVWTGSCGPVNLVTCNDNASSTTPQSQVVFTTDGVSTYYIVGEGHSGEIGELHVHINSP